MTPNLRDIQQCQLWLSQHLVAGAGLAQAMSTLAGAVNSLRRSARAGDDVLPVLELIRGSLIGPAEQITVRVASAAGLPDVRASAQLQALDALLEQMHLTVLACGAAVDRSELHRQMPGAHASLEEALPLARAVQLQSMRIVARLRTRTCVPDQLWQDLGELATVMRHSSFLDETLGSAADHDGNRTSRSWLILPVLLKIAALEEHSPPQAGLIYRLASHWADRVGFRIDPLPLRKPNPHGPSLKLGAKFRLRLDTHRLRNAMVRRQARWMHPDTEPAQLPMQLSRVQLADLLEDLFGRWSAEWRAPRARPAPPGKIRIRPGLPGRELVAARYWENTAEQAYEYGQYQREVLLAPAAPVRMQEHAQIARRALLGAEMVDWVQVDRQCVIVERRETGPAPMLGGIVAFGLDDKQAVSTETRTPNGLRLGWVRAVQRVPGSVDHPDRQRITLDTFAGRPTPVQIEDNSPGLACGAYLLTGQASLDGHGDTLFVAPARVGPGARIRLRRPGDQISVEIGARLRRGPDYDQFAVRARGSSSL